MRTARFDGSRSYVCPTSGKWDLARYLIMNPRGDDEFVRLTNEAARDVSTPEDLEGRLRKRYPAAVVRPRLLEAEPNVVWYVYRDGRWVLSTEASEDRDE